MPSCIIDNIEYRIELADTPFTIKWLDKYEGKTLTATNNYPGTQEHKRLTDIITKYQKLFSKFNLNDLCDFEQSKLWLNDYLTKIHLCIFNFQTTYKGGAQIMNLNTNKEWDEMHELIHTLETQVLHGTKEFKHGSVTLDHDSDALTDSWSWQPVLTAEEFHRSASFENWHIDVPFAELGRHPYECFLYSPDTWNTEGSMLGQINNKIIARPSKSSPRPNLAYEQWCSDHNLPTIGDHFPLANFVDKKDAQMIINAKEIIIRH